MKNFKKVFSIFRKNYVNVPLEVFGKNKYKTLISTVLSSRTNDDTTLKVCKNLFTKAPDFKSLNKFTESEISKLIYPVSFYKTKAKHLKELSKLVLKKFNGNVPDSREELIKLPGVGGKTANLVLNRAFGKDAVAVDTHVHKISNLLGWVSTKTPDETEKELHEIVPKKYWKDMNRFFVSIGRQYTTKKRLVEFLEKKGLIPQ